jgi:uncharacterized protein with HEPN domain
MNPNERNYAYLWDMREAARLVTKFLYKANFTSFESDKMLQSAVERQLEIIGEAAHRVTPDFQEAHPEIPWRSIIGLRNILIHEYGEVRVDRIWLIVSTRIPELVGILDPLIPPIDGDLKA